MAYENTAVPRIPLSLRLPVAVVKTVGSYATAHSVSKTDAFLHFLYKGMASDQPPDLEIQLEDIKSELEQIKMMISQEAFVEISEQDKAREAISRTATEYPAIRQAYLFGSFARGDYTNQSDIDIRLELDRAMPFNLHDLARFQKNIERDTGRAVDIVSAERLKNEHLAAAIEREKVLVYERQK